MTDAIYQAHRNLVAAILDQGVEEAKRGCQDAIDWLEGDSFSHWCAWFGIDPDAARAAIRPQINPRRHYTPKRELTQQEVKTVLAVYNKCGSWNVAAREIGVSVTHLRNRMIEAGYHTPRPRARK